MSALFRRLDQVQNARRYRQIPVRSDDIHMVRQDLHLVLDLNHGHCCVGCQHLCHLAFACRIKVQHQNKGCTAVSGHRIKEFAERLDPTSRCAHADDQTTMFISCARTRVRRFVR